jgi:ureidoglycolate lyase
VSPVELHAVPLTAERFAPYGQVIAPLAEHRDAMNAARFERFDDLAKVDVDTEGDAHAAISIARSRSASVLPYTFDMVERHPLGSQAFIPLSRFRFAVVVAPAGESVDAADLRAFVTNGQQGISYRRGTWHMPLIAFETAHDFLIVDRAGGGGNCEEHVFDQRITLHVD